MTDLLLLLSSLLSDEVFLSLLPSLLLSCRFSVLVRRSRPPESLVVPRLPLLVAALLPLLPLPLSELGFDRKLSRLERLPPPPPASAFFDDDL